VTSNMLPQGRRAKRRAAHSLLFYSGRRPESGRSCRRLASHRRIVLATAVQSLHSWAPGHRFQPLGNSEIQTDKGRAPMNVLLLSMPDSFERMPALAIRMPNGGLRNEP